MELVRHLNRFREVKWSWNSLSLHPSVNLQVLKNLRDKPWNWSLLTKNPKFSWMWVQEFPEKEWDWIWLSSCDSFSWNWVREFPDAHWNWNVLSDKIIDIQTVKDFPDASWNWYKLTLGPQISVGDMMANPNLPWTINQLLFVDIDDEFVSFLRFFRSHYDSVAWKDHTSRTPWKIIKRNMDLPWDLFFLRLKSSDEFGEDDVRVLYENVSILNWTYLSEMLDFETIISKCPDLPWTFFHVSKNKTVSYKDVLKFPDLDWDHSCIQLEDDKREWNAANIIKKYWKKCATDPSYKMCRRVVLGHLTSISIGGNDICENECHSEV